MISVVFAIGSVLFIIGLIGSLWHFESNNVKECIIFLILTVIGIASIVVIIPFTKETNTVTIHFIDTDTYVTYENATTYRSRGGTFVVTAEGNKIQIVNAEISVT